jgi:hypothetical protein
LMTLKNTIGRMSHKFKRKRLRNKRIYRKRGKSKPKRDKLSWRQKRNNSRENSKRNKSKWQSKRKKSRDSKEWKSSILHFHKLSHLRK